MEVIARQALGLKTPPAAAPKRTSSKSHAKPVPPPVPPPLVDEKFRVFELAYGSGATMVLSARTDAPPAAAASSLPSSHNPISTAIALVLLKNVTDAAHLDDTPRMRLVDAVDALADNRGELLFELRGTTQRQFALYRVLRGTGREDLRHRRRRLRCSSRTVVHQIVIRLQWLSGAMRNGISNLSRHHRIHVP